MRYLKSSKTLIIGLFFALTFSLFFLPTLFPKHIGTAYICISFAMSALSILIWHRNLITPQYALIVSLLACVILGALQPYTSNDSERYLWDGAAFLSGIDPYITPPNGPAVSSLRQIWPTPEEHANYPTLYPPGAVALFAVCALAGPVFGIWVWKIMTTIAAMLTLLLIYKLLLKRNIIRHFYLIAFSPLLLFEPQVGAHLDVFSALGIIAGLWSIEKDKILMAGIIIGLCATIKILPAVVIGPYLFYLRPQQSLKLFLSSAAAWLSVYSVTFGFGYKPIGLLPTFFEKWRGGAPIYPLLEYVQTFFGGSNRDLLMSIIAIALLGFSVSARLACKKKIELAVLLSLSIPLLLSPVLFPWYFLALIPLFALKPSYVLFAAITLTPLSYVVLNRWLLEGIWAQPIWPTYILLLGLTIGLLLDVINGIARANKRVAIAN